MQKSLGLYKYELTGSPSLGNWANRSSTSYLTICELRSFKQCQKFFLCYKYQNMQDCSQIMTPWCLTYQAWCLLLPEFLACVSVVSCSGFTQWRPTLASCLTVRCSFYPSLLTVVYYISICSVKWIRFVSNGLIS